MKKLFITIVSMLLPMMASADVVEIDGLYYNLISKVKTAEVTSNPNRYSGNVNIPEKVKHEGTEYSVTNIGEFAFRECTELTSVTIPNSVISIGHEAFSGCTGLTSVTIPKNVTSIGDAAFIGCNGLTSVTIPNSVTSIGNAAFMDCKNLPSITIPNSVTSLGTQVFSYCSSLTSITISNNVTSIEGDAFSYCSALTSINIPNSVTNIGHQAFYSCNVLASITIGSGIKTIDTSAFSSCPDLTDVYCYAENVPNTQSDIFKDSYIEYATLHVPASSVNAYKTIEPWKNFNKIVAIDGDMPEAPKSSTPIISYNNGELAFNCDTEGAEFVYEISDADIKKGYAANVKLDATYHISVYATKIGYDNSDVATATLCWIDANPKTEGISNGVANVRAMPVMIQNNGNALNITGAPEGCVINVYDLSGQMVGSSKAISDTTNISTSLHGGEIGIVKIGDKSVKIMVK